MELLTRFNEITCFIFDMDGVLTDGMLYLTGSEQNRRMNIKDGYALQLAVKKGYYVAVFSGAVSEPARERLSKLGITDVFMGVLQKAEKMSSYLADKKISWNQVLYMGDDIPDVLALQQAGLPCAPADAVPEVKHICRYISSINGGFGCVRDVIEKVMKIRGDWELETSIPSK